MDEAQTDRMWARVLMTPEHWLWQGARLYRGYGVFRVGRKVCRVHRLVWEALRGPIAGGDVLKNRCGELGCCRPTHWALARHGLTHADMQQAHHPWAMRASGVGA